MKIMGKNYDNKTLIVGGVLCIALCAVPFVGNLLISLITSVRSKFSSVMSNTFDVNANTK